MLSRQTGWAAFTDLFHASEHHHPDPAHSQDGSPKKNKFQNLAHFSAPKKRPPNHHVYHASHHVFTIKKQLKTSFFCKIPCKINTTPSKKNLRLGMKIVPS
jgi:hypothetical protein